MARVPIDGAGETPNERPPLPSLHKHGVGSFESFKPLSHPMDVAIGLGQCLTREIDAPACIELQKFTGLPRGKPTSASARSARLRPPFA